MHYAPTDVPTVFMGSWARLPFSWLFRMSEEVTERSEPEGPAPIPASLSLSVCSDLAVKYLEKESFQAFLHHMDRYLIYGTSYIDQ